jgi:hypothetical protein
MRRMQIRRRSSRLPSTQLRDRFDWPEGLDSPALGGDADRRPRGVLPGMRMCSCLRLERRRRAIHHDGARGRNGG